jgi:hypothetical protein
VDRAAFWELVEVIDRAALHRFDDAAAVRPLILALAAREEREIFAFEEELARLLYDLDGREHADQADASGGSSDGFLYARCFVVASGQRHYDHVLANPSAMPKSLDEWCEALLYVAQRAWAERTGRDEEEWDCDTSVSYETGSNEARWT